MIDTTKWKSFLVDDIFECKTCPNSVKVDLEDGVIPYISRTAINNGRDGQVAVEIEKITKGNCITIGAEGLYAFYQSDDFATGVKIYTIRCDEMDRKIGLFIATLLNMQVYKYNYGRARILEKIKQEQIKLPVDSNGNPDWKYMREFIESLENVESIRNSLNTRNVNKKTSEIIDVNYWGEFELGKLFDKIYKAKAYVKGELETIDYPKVGYIPFITRTENNNACDAYVSLADIDYYEKGNAMIIGDTTSTTFYQKGDFATGDHIVVCRAKWINNYTALFLKAIIDKDRYRYNYGRAFKMDLIKKTVVKLPKDNQGNPDFSYMESYIKGLLYGDKI